MTVKDFVYALAAIKKDEFAAQNTSATTEMPSKQNHLSIGHKRGWLEDSDERFPEATLDRRTAARIIHQYLLIEQRIPDLPDITNATKLIDLYTCRACANHIAQIYERGIMDAEELPSQDSAHPKQTVLVFNHLEPVSLKQADIILEKVRKLINSKID